MVAIVTDTLLASLTWYTESLVLTCSLWRPNFLDATVLQPFSGVGTVSLNDVQMLHLHWKKRIHEWSMRQLFISHLFTVVKFVYHRAFEKKGIFEGFDSCVWRSNLNQIGFKSSIFRSVWPLNLMVDLENNRTPLLNYVKRCTSFQSHRWIGSGEYA